MKFTGIIASTALLAFAIADGVSADTSAPDNRALGGFDYKAYNNRGCRTGSGDKGREGHDYDLYKHFDKRRCESKCNDHGSRCKGFEYSSDGRCEVWFSFIKRVSHSSGLTCYVKKFNHRTLRGALEASVVDETPKEEAIVQAERKLQQEDDDYYTDDVDEEDVDEEEVDEDEELEEEFFEFDEDEEDEEDFEFDEDEEDFEFDDDEEDEEGNKLFKTRAYHGKKYHFYNNKVCRTRHGGVGKEGHDYIEVHSYNCKATCDEYSWCQGYESGPHGHCELWKYRPQKVATKHGFKCAVQY